MEEIRRKFEEAGQGHIFHFLDNNQLSDSEKKGFLNQLKYIDVDYVNEIYKESTNFMNDSREKNVDLNMNIEPLEYVDSTSTCSTSQHNSWLQCGLKNIAKGNVGIILLAGGARN